MNLFDNVFGENHNNQWFTSYTPAIKLVEKDNTTIWLMVHNISEIIEAKEKLTIKMVSGANYSFDNPDAIKAVRMALVEAHVVQ